MSAPCQSTARCGLQRSLPRGSGSRHAIAVALCCLLVCLVSALSSQSPAVAAESSAPPSPPKPPEALKPDHLGRSTPYGTVIGFLRAADKDDFELAYNYLELKQPSKKNEQL